VNWLLGGALILLSVWTVFYLEIDAWVLMGLTTVAVGAGLVWPAWPAPGAADRAHAGVSGDRGVFPRRFVARR